MPKEKFDPNDFVDHDDADAAIEEEGEDLGNELSEEQEDDPGEKKTPAKKAPAKKAPAKKDESEEDDEPEEEEDDEHEQERAKLAKKLARAGRARNQLETQVKELRSQLDAQNRDKSDAAKKKIDALKDELEGLYEKVEEFRAEGKTGEAAKAQRRIDEIRDGMTRSQAAALALNEAIAQTETRAYNQMVRELEVIDTRFDADHEDFDQDLMDSIAELVEGYEGKGMPLTDALRKACKLVLREDVFAAKRGISRKEPEKRTPEKVERKTPVKKNIDASKRQPPDNPNQRREKADADVDLATISEKDFDALPEATLRRLLGDDGS